MSYHNRLAQLSRRAQDREPEDGFGVLVCGMWIVAFALAVALLWWVVA